MTDQNIAGQGNSVPGVIVAQGKLPDLKSWQKTLAARSIDARILAPANGCLTG